MITQYEPLAKTFRKHDSDMQMVMRQGDVAVFARKSATMTAFEYEVVIVQKTDEKEMFGKVYPAHEVMPGDEEWGRYGWSTNRWIRALKIFNRELAKRGFLSEKCWVIEPLEPWTKSTTGE
jgi:hypothetical protein